METKGPSRRFYLITYPRTASNLLVRMLALDKQTNVLAPAKQGGYFFLPSFMKSRELSIREKVPEQWTTDERQRMMEAYQDSFGEFEKYLAQTEEQDKIAFVKEHALFLLEPTVQARLLFGDAHVSEPPWTVQSAQNPLSKTSRSSLNKTILPDEFLQSFQPTFLIRHPALSYPSFYRARRDLAGEEGAMAEGVQFSVTLTLRWTRDLYDFYAQSSGSSTSQSQRGSVWPVVLDADDIITQPDVLVHFCELVGMDPEKLQFEWKPVPTEEKQAWDERKQRMLSTLSNSAGIDKSKTAASIDIDAEAKKWKAEFGEEMGSTIEHHVRESMPDYEFLRSKRLRPKARAPQSSETRKASRLSKTSVLSAESAASSVPPATRASPTPKPRRSISGLLSKLLPCIPSANKNMSK